MKTAYFILGVESSGTRMLTASFIAAGCWGDSGHTQRLDQGIPEELPDQIVFRRSVPHSGKLPKVEAWIQRFEAAGYHVQVVKIQRDSFPNTRSMVRRGHAKTISQAISKFASATEFLKSVEGLTVYYRPFVTNAAYRQELFGRLGLRAPNMDYFDGDSAYL